MSHNNVILLLGSNLGNKEKNLKGAISELESANCIINKKTKILNNPPVEYQSCNNFCNIAIEIRTSLSPIELLELIKRIEKKMGRVRDSKDIGRYMDRVIDIDIVTFNTLRFYCDRLEIPHLKNLHERAFSKQLVHELLKQ